jgi:hypothetical protein
MPSATVDSIIDAALNALVPVSGQEMYHLITNALAIANEARDYEEFRRNVYAGERFSFCRIMCDSRETVPITLALVRLAEGDVEKTVTYAANFGRDADTIATMGGAIAGVYQSVMGIRSDWVEKARKLSKIDQDDLAERLMLTSRVKYDSQQLARQDYLSIW